MSTRQKDRPNFLVRPASGAMRVLEVKGQDSQENERQQELLDKYRSELQVDLW
jgi:hypothetical protein